jgi:DNA invertase Pin-like site-specific DNA recombinase
VADLLHIVERVHAKGAILHIGNIGRVDPKEPTGALLLNVLGAIAQFERQMMLERQREGIAKAKRRANTGAERRPREPRPPTC